MVIGKKLSGSVISDMLKLTFSPGFKPLLNFTVIDPSFPLLQVTSVEFVIEDNLGGADFKAL